MTSMDYWVLRSLMLVAAAIREARAALGAEEQG